MQAKRIQVNESNDGVGGHTTVSLQAPLEPREDVNFHNIWVGVTIEPQDTDANCQGTWVLYKEDISVRPEQAFTDATLNLEVENQNIIACGVFSASNQSPFNYSTQIKTSRNTGAGGRIILSSTITGITAGLASNRVMLCAHTVRK